MPDTPFGVQFEQGSIIGKFPPAFTPMMNTDSPIASSVLVGNSFPLSMVRRRVVIEPVSIGTLQAALKGKAVRSFWGHANTLSAINHCLGLDLTPPTDRPALFCDPLTRFPTLDGQVFSECWVVSPEYEPGFRPAVGEEVSSEKIKGWQVLRLTWCDQP